MQFILMWFYLPFVFSRTQGDSRMATFFGNNFIEERWRKAALKNAYSLLSKQRFEHAVAFFLLADALWDAIRLCISHLKDIQLALVIARLYDSGSDNSIYKKVLSEYVLGEDQRSCVARKGELFLTIKMIQEHLVYFISVNVSKDRTRYLGDKQGFDVLNEGPELVGPSLKTSKSCLSPR